MTGAAQAAVITHTFNTKFTPESATPSGAPTVSFNDMGGTGTVTMTINLAPLSSPEFLADYWLNYAGAGATALTISRTGGTGPTTGITINPVVSNGYNSPGNNGLFDAYLQFATSNAGGGAQRFDAEESLIFTLLGTGITASSFGVLSASEGGAGGTARGQVHIQGITGGGSAQMGPGGVGTTPVPEPATLALLGLGLIGAGWTIRRRKSR